MDRGAGELHGRGLHPEGPPHDGGGQHSVNKGDKEQIYWRSSWVWVYKFYQRPSCPDLYAQTQWQNDSKLPSTRKVQAESQLQPNAAWREEFQYLGRRS